MWADGIIILAPAIEFLLGIGDRMKQMFVETFIAEPPMERFNIWIIGRRLRADKVEVDMLLGSLLSDGFADKLRVVIYRDRLGAALLFRQPIEDVDDALPGEGYICLNRQTFAAEGIFNGQQP